MVGHAAIKNERRKSDLYFCQSDHIELTHIEPYLNSIGIKQSDLVVYWGDISPNTAFYLMNRRGWGLWALDGSLTIEGIDKCTAKGAKFLIIDQNQNRVDSLNDVIKKYGHHEISDRDNIQIYSLL